MNVEYVNHMGNDLSVVNAARVSFDKVSNEFKESDERLINYLCKHNHWSPFAHTAISFRISAPIFVARQLVKHQVGLVWNEVSRRYVDTLPRVYYPDAWRSRPTDKKQGSGLTVLGPLAQEVMGELYQQAIVECVETYNDLIKGGVAPEQARMVLPLSVYTEWIWTGSLYAFARICQLRIKPDAQEETRIVVEQIYKIIESLFPVSWKALCGNLVDNEQGTTV